MEKEQSLCSEGFESIKSSRDDNKLVAKPEPEELTSSVSRKFTAEEWDAYWLSSSRLGTKSFPSLLSQKSSQDATYVGKKSLEKRHGSNTPLLSKGDSSEKDKKYKAVDEPPSRQRIRVRRKKKPTEGPSVEKTPAEGVPDRETPVEEPPVEKTPAGEAPAEEEKPSRKFKEKCKACAGKIPWATVVGVALVLCGSIVGHVVMAVSQDRTALAFANVSSRFRVPGTQEFANIVRSHKISKLLSLRVLLFSFEVMPNGRFRA